MSTSVPAEISIALQTGSIADALGATLHHFHCQVGTVHVLRDGLLRLTTHTGLPPHIAQIVETVPIGKGIAGLAAERREPVNICNLQSDASGQARPAAKGTGMEGSLAVPMLAASGELRGVLGIATAEAHDWTKEETDVVMAIGAAFAEKVGV
jgi:signal transduction protein with GAF and PtsI domain